MSWYTPLSMVASLLSKSPVEVLGECSGSHTLIKNMPMGFLFEGKEVGFRKALTTLLSPGRSNENIEEIRSMTVQQFLAYQKQERRLDAADLP